jgi:hypothetical protein
MLKINKRKCCAHKDLHKKLKIKKRKKENQTKLESTIISSSFFIPPVVDIESLARCILARSMIVPVLL